MGFLPSLDLYFPKQYSMLRFPLVLRRRFIPPNHSFSIFNKIFGAKDPSSTSSTNPNPHPNPNSNPQKPKPNRKAVTSNDQDDYNLLDRQKQTLKAVDYIKLQQESRSLPDKLGQGGIEEIIFWTEGVETPEDIVKMVGLFNKHWSEEAVDICTQNYKFQDFSNKVIKYSFLAKDFPTLNQLAEFGLLYNINEDELWKKLQEKLLNLLRSKEDINLVCDILLKFTKMGKGDMIYYKVDDLAEANIKSLTPSSVSKVLYIMWQRETGDIKTIKKYLQRFQETIPDSQPEDIILLSTFLPFVQLEDKTLYNLLEKKMLEDRLLDKMGFQELSVVAKGYGHGNGSDAFWEYIQNLILTKDSITLRQAQYVLYGPLNSYRLSPSGAKKITSMVLAHKSQLKAVDLSQLSKVLYMYQLDNETIYQQIEALVINQLQDLQATPLSSLMHICKNYSVTRHGSRDIYKMLEVVVMARMGEIKLNRKVFRAIYNIYNKSDLCSADMIKEFAKYR